jgi:hypothetical protein
MRSLRKPKRLAADKVDTALLGRIAGIRMQSANNGGDFASSITLLSKTSSRHSVVSTYRIETPSGPKYVVAKRVRDPSPRTAEFLQREYDTLQKISQVAGAGLADTFPNALLFSPDRIVLSMVAGVSLDGQLKRTANALTGWLSTRHMTVTGRQIAEWLGRFHAQIGSGDIGHDHERYATELDRLLRKCAAFGLTATTLRQVREASLRLSRALQYRTMPAAASHGDFIPQNILLHHGKLGVVDFASYSDCAPVYQDVTHFVGYLLLLGAKPFYSGKRLGVFASSFLAGYPLTLDGSLLRVFLIKAVLRLISDGNPVPTYLSRFRTGNLDSLLLRLTDEQRPLPFGIQL